MFKRKDIRSRDIIRVFRGDIIDLFVPAKDPVYIYISLGIITFLAVILRLYYIGYPIGYDEAYTFIRFSSKPFKFILADYHAPNNHILNSLLIGIVYRVIGNHLWVVRVPAFIASVLGVPAAFITGRRFFSTPQALAASVILAVSPTFIYNAINGRGYSLIIFFSLLLANFAGILAKKESRSALVAYAITGALGFYTIPIFLYPMAGISLWVAVTYLTAVEPWQNRWRKVSIFLVTCVISGVLTLILYSPVIIFGTGFESLVSNEIVKSQEWRSFLANFITRSNNTWLDWTYYASPLINQVLLAGFVISLVFYRKSSSQRLPMQLFFVLGAGIMLVLQRVAPLPRIWGYLEMFYLFFSATGLVWLASWIIARIWRREAGVKILSGLVLLIALIVFANITIKTQNKQARANQWIAPEFFVADYIATHRTEEDTVIAVAPADMQTAYYLLINGVPYDVFYQRDHPVEIKNAYVLVQTRGDYGVNTLEKLLDFYKLTNNLDLNAGSLVFDYGPLLLYSIPAK